MIHIAARHGFKDLSPSQAMGTASFLIGVFGDTASAKSYAAARFIEKEGAGLSLPTMLKVLHQDASGWKNRDKANHGGGQAPVQTSRIEVRDTEWSRLPETQAWYDPANHIKI